MNVRGIALASLVVCSYPALAQEVMTPALRDASQFQRQDRFDEADAKIREAINADPKSQRARLFLGLNQKYQHNYRAAEETLSATIALKPGSNYAGQAYFLIAKSQSEDGRRAEAKKTIADMQTLYPDSGWLPQAWLLKAQIDDAGVSEAEAKLDRQNAAEPKYAKIIAAKTTSGTAVVMAALRQLATDYKGLPIELQARESVAHLLTTDGATSDAIDAFTALVEEVAPSAPKSRIVLTARLRLGYLFLRTFDRENAMTYFMSIVNSDTQDRKLFEEALFQSGGIAFEFLQRDLQSGRKVYSYQWKELHNLFNALRTLENASTETLIRADLMQLEAYDWSGHPEKTIPFGKEMLQKYSDRTDCRTEYATALILMARVSKDHQQYQDCIAYAKRALSLYPTEKEIWPGMDHLQRAYHDLHTALRLAGDDAEADRVKAEFVERFPDSAYLKVVQR